MKKCISLLLIVVIVISLASISCGKKKTAASKDSLLNSRSVSTWKSENNSSKIPFRLSAWKDNYHSCDLELTWRGDGSPFDGSENLYIFEKDTIAVGVEYNKKTDEYSGVTMLDGNYSGKVDFADFGVIGAGYTQRFSGFYLYYNSGNQLNVENLSDNNLHNEIGTSVNEVLDGYQFVCNQSRFTKLNNGQRNSFGFFEYNFKPMSDTKDGNGDYTIPLLNQGDYFVLVPFDDDGTTKTKKKEFAQQYQVKQFPPENLILSWNSNKSELNVTWSDNDVNGDNWDLTLECSIGEWSGKKLKTITISDLTTKSYTIVWDPLSTPQGTENTFTATVVDSYGASTKDSTTHVLGPIINVNVNKIWLTYKCANNPPRQGDYIYVYSYLQNPILDNYGFILMTLWSNQGALTPQTSKSSEYPLGYKYSYMNLGGRGTANQPDGISATGAVTTPSSRYFYDRDEGFIDDIGGDKDYGIWTASSQDILDYFLINNTQYIPEYQTDLSDPMQYYTLTQNQTRSYGQSSVLNIGDRLNNGDPIDAWLYSYYSIANPPPEYLRKFDNGYLINCVFKVNARKGSEITIGLLTCTANNSEVENADIKSGYIPKDGSYKIINTNSQYIPYFPVNEIKFTVQ